MVANINAPHADCGNLTHLPRSHAETQLPIRQETRKRHARVKTGCLTCRRRKKKCDEVKPACSGCRRNKLSCDWPVSSRSLDRTNAEVQLPDHFELIGRNDPGYEVEKNHNRFQRQLFPYNLLNLISWKGGAPTLTRESSLFLRHYATETGDILAVQRVHKNPFLTHLLPLASSDDLLMHSVLAIGGVHLAARLPSSVEVDRSALTHYGAMVEGVRTAMKHLKDDDHASIIRLLLILIMLCHYQIMEGAEDGKFYVHLKACHGLIQKLFGPGSSLQDISPAQNDVLGFCLELYAYIMVSNYVSPFGTLMGQPLQLDTTLLSHDHLSSYSTFGTMFGDLYGLYQFLPQITRLASQRLEEEEAGYIEPSEDAIATHRNLTRNIGNWSPTLPRFDMDPQDWKEQNQTGEMIRRGLYICLLTAMAGSVVSDWETLEVIQTYSRTMLKIMLKLVQSKYQTLFLWPALICGSCLTDETLQRQLTEGIKNSPCQAKHVFTACTALELLWADPDPRAYGPYGLNRLKERGFWIPML